MTSIKERHAILNLEADEIEDHEVHIPMHLAFRNLTVKTGDKILLEDVSGEVRPGEILAIMGASGAGKTTLLNLLAGRTVKTCGQQSSGVVTINGEKASKRLRRRIGYVPQEDCFFSHLTVRQTLEFAGQLRLPDSMSSPKKLQKVDELMECLGLKKCANTLMGGGIFVKGISGGERKRSSVAVELITNPSLLLMDEPTSGLDSSTALNLVSTLQTLARSQNRAIVATIHQPSSQLFYMFDKLLLLCNGQVAYFGETHAVVDYFNSLNMPCHPNWNPADYIMEMLTSGPEIESKIIDAFKERKSIIREPLATNEKALNNSHSKDSSDSPPISMSSSTDGCRPVISMNGIYANGDGEDVHFLPNVNASKKQLGKPRRRKKTPKWPTGFYTQFRVLSSRAFIQTKSNLWDKLGFIQTLLIATIVGLVWWDIPPTEESLHDMHGVLYCVTLQLAWGPMFSALYAFPTEREVIAKERVAGMYRLSAYFFAKCVSELPLVLFQPLIYHAIVYWASGMNRSEYYLASVAVVCVEVVFSQSLGLLISAIVTELKQSLTVAVVIGITCAILGGFYTRNFAPWLAWVRYLSYTSHAYNAFLQIEFSNNPRSIRCATALSGFRQCQVNATSLLSTNGTSMGVISGADVYEASRSIPVNALESIALLIGATFATRLACYLGLRFLNKQR